MMIAVLTTLLVAELQVFMGFRGY
jgi:hypothetical protein